MSTASHTESDCPSRNDSTATATTITITITQREREKENETTQPHHPLNKKEGKSLRPLCRPTDGPIGASLKSAGEENIDPIPGDIT